MSSGGSSSTTSKNSSQAGGGAAARVSIPSGVSRTIQQIKEITGNHSEEEIYAMLKECSMDPNDTIARLIFQDTFHEVKRKRERKRENTNKDSVEPKGKPGLMGRGNKAERGNFSSRYASQDGIGGRNSASGKENGNIHNLEKSLSSTYVPHPKEEKSATRGSSASSPNELSVGASAPATSTVFGKLAGLPQQRAPTDATKRPNVEERTRSNHGLAVHTSDSSTSFASVASSDTQLPASDRVPLASQDSKTVDALGGIKSERQSQCAAAAAIYNENKTTGQIETSDVCSNVQGKKPATFQGSGKNQPVISSQMDSSQGGSFSRPSSNYNNRSQAIGPQKAGHTKEWKPKATNSTLLPGSITDSSSEAPTVSVGPDIMLESRQDTLETSEVTLEVQKKLDKVQISEVQHVIIPDHLHVPDAEKLGFCFGSFDAIYELSTSINTTAENDQSPSHSESSVVSEENAREHFPSNEGALSSVDEADNSDNNPLSSSPEEVIASSKVGEISPSVPEYNEVKPENLQGDHQYSIVQTPPSYGFIPPILGSQTGPFESSESQARVSNFVIQQPFDPTSYYTQLYRSGVDCDGRISPFHPTGVQAKFNGNVAVMSPPIQQSIQEGGSTLVLSTAAATPLVTQAAAGLIQTSIAVPQPPLPALFRQPTGMHLPHFPANYIPYGHYFHPFYPPPAMHQFFSSGAFPQQPQAGSVYQQQPSPAPTPKYSLSQYNNNNKQQQQGGANAPNPTYIGLPGSYGPYGSATANFNPTLTTTAGNPTSNEDRPASQFKENNNVYGGGQQSEGLGVWISAAGRDISSLHAGSFYNLPPHGQVTFSPTQPGHGTFASGIYHPTPLITPPTGHPLLQQSQNISVPNEMAGPTANIYQQQHSQINWPGSY
ncbi:hypothetical protein DM860_002874 [Cuscuta australis]|uniref:GBF-interacting protein 1 N-terminal domain-containing protein n=1 Tax=Cuscuta australis TaxID=267555 RepID=A0A328D4J3_9ASTE|nr:hypothetical protein DM860_002874 [Cuscuta australis]